MSSIESNIRTTQSDADKQEIKNFGLLMAVAIPLVFGIVLPLVWGLKVSWVPFGVGALFLFLAFFARSILTPVFSVWMKFAIVLGTINSTIILSFIFVFMFVPVSLFFRLIKRDALTRNFDPKLSSYRVIAETSIPPSEHMDRPF